MVREGVDGGGDRRAGGGGGVTGLDASGLGAFAVGGRTRGDRWSAAEEGREGMTELDDAARGMELGGTELGKEGRWEEAGEGRETTGTGRTAALDPRLLELAACCELADPFIRADAGGEDLRLDPTISLPLASISSNALLPANSLFPSGLTCLSETHTSNPHPFPSISSRCPDRANNPSSPPPSLNANGENSYSRTNRPLINVCPAAGSARSHDRNPRPVHEDGSSPAGLGNALSVRFTRKLGSKLYTEKSSDVELGIHSGLERASQLILVIRETRA